MGDKKMRPFSRSIFEQKYRTTSCTDANDVEANDDDDSDGDDDNDDDGGRSRRVRNKRT